MSGKRAEAGPPVALKAVSSRQLVVLLCRCVWWTAAVASAASSASAASDAAGGWRLQVNYTDAELVNTELNRKYFYPRCLLFNECDPLVQAAALHHFNSDWQILPPDSAKPRNSSIATRMQGHPFLGQVLTPKLLQSTLLRLHPTHPRLFSELEKKAGDKSNFKVIYLSQGPRRTEVNSKGQTVSSLPDWYSQMTDFIFLAFSEDGRPQASDLTTIYFPHSIFEQGRLSLLVAARILELRQGWLYDYFVFLDDDVGLRSGSVSGFERDLQMWLPAIGSPLYPTQPHFIYPTATSVGHVDHIYIGYHREALEVLFPKVTKYNHRSWFHSDWLQILEHSLAYRNHLLIFPSLFVTDLKHRAYPQICNFDKLIWTFRASLSPLLGGCVPPYTYRKYPAYFPIGETRKKEHSYSSFEHLYNRTNSAGSCGCWNTSFTDCCTVDAERRPVVSAAPQCTDPIPNKRPVKDGALMQCMPEKVVYLIANQTRRPFAHASAFTRMGFEFSDVERIDAKECDERLYWVDEEDTIF